MESHIALLGAGPPHRRDARWGGEGATVMAAAAGAASPADKERYRGHGFCAVGSLVGSFAYVSLKVREK